MVFRHSSPCAFVALSAVCAVGCGSANGANAGRIPDSENGSGSSSTSSTSIGQSASSSALPQGEAGTPVPHHVSACRDGGAGAANTWANITPADVKIGADSVTANTYGTVEIVLDPSDPANVFTAGQGAGLFKSTDCGANWTHINTGMNGSVLDSGALWSIVIDPTNPQVMFAANGYGSDPSLFKSTDGGVDWVSLWPQGSVVQQAVQYNAAQEVSMDPTDNTHLVVSFHSACNAPHSPNCLGESRDSGANWAIIDGPLPPSGGSWAEGASPTVLGPKAFIFATPQNGMFYTGDDGATWQMVAPSGNQQLYRRADGTLFIGSSQSILMSSDMGQTWNPITGSPGACGLVGDGTTMWAVVQFGGADPLYSATESNPTTWTQVTTPDWSADGGNYLAYDSDHHLLYAGTQRSGLWREMTQ